MVNTERRRLWNRQRRITQLLAVIGVVCAAAFVSVTLSPPLTRRVRQAIASRGSTATVKPVKLPASRPIYPYSVIKGGAYSNAELIDALDRDPVAARHYSVFRRSLVHTVVSPFTNPVYLSYRVGNAIYWTSRPVQLSRGETLLTDGQNFARARCGNRICETPQTPVNETEPAPEILNTPRPPANAIADIGTWTEDRLGTPMAPVFGLLPARPELLSAVSGVPPETGPLTFWSYIPPIGILAAPLSPPPLVLIPQTPPPVIPPYLWPPTPFYPITPNIPVGPNSPPPPPTQPVPEPALIVPTLLACGGFAVARRRKR